LSSATADIGDPVICHLNTLREFGQSVFPRGSYLGGHLEADKEPGHFVGKGYLKLEFDRIGFPSSDVPVPSKVIAAKGYKLDRHGDIIGHGHATRDVVEWMIPPLWPWKVITLPARGPRPALKGEEQITVRLMDDIQIPRMVASAQSYERPAVSERPRPAYRPQSLERPANSYQPQSIEQTQEVAAPADNLAEVSELPLMQAELAETSPAAVRRPLRIKWLALKRGEIYAATNYQIHDGSVNYVLSTGAKGSMDITAIDWRKTTQMNAELGASSDGARERAIGGIESSVRQ